MTLRNMLTRLLPLLCPTVVLVAGCNGQDTVHEQATVVLAARGAGNPTVAIDSRSGAAYAAWIETHEGMSNVMVARVDSTGRGAAVRANDIAGDAAPHEQAPPQLAVGPDGILYVVWQNNTTVPGRQFPASNLRLARSTDGGRTFSPAVFVNDDAGGPPSSHTFHDLAVAPDGALYVSWIDGRERTEADGANDNGHTMHDAGMPGSDVRVARSLDGGRTFTTGVVVYRNVCPCCRTALAIAADGEIAVAFRSAARDVRDIMVARSSDHGQTFSAPVRVHADKWHVDACPHAGASIAFSDGRLHVAWYTGAEARQGVWYTRSTVDGSSFEQPQPLLTSAWIPVSRVNIAAGHDDAVWIAWDDRRGDEPVARLALATDGSARPLPVRAAGSSPALAAGTNVVLAWQHGDSASARMLRY